MRNFQIINSKDLTLNDCFENDYIKTKFIKFLLSESNFVAGKIIF